MATSKPRITVALTKRQHEVLKTIANCGGQTMSGMLGEFIETAMPTFERMAATFQQLKRASDKERERIGAALDDAQAVLEPVAMASLAQFDLFLGKAAAVGKAGECKAPTVGPTASPPTNRGVTPSKGKQLQASTAKASKVVLKKKVLKKVAGE